MATYLIDYENTGVKGLIGIEDLKEEDLIVLFYGPKTGAVPFDEHVKISSAVARVEYFKTTKTAKNYLDFQLTTYLGYLVSQTEVKEYYVISKDSGYDAVVDFWKLRGMTIRRQENIKNEKQPQVTAKAATKSAAKPASSAKQESKPAQKQTGRNHRNAAAGNKAAAIQSAVAETEMTPEKENASDTATVLAPAIDAEPAKATEAPRPANVPENVKKKIRNILKGENLQGGAYKQIYSCMLRAKDKQSFNTALVKVFTQEQGNHFYKLLLPVFTEWTK